MTASTASIPVLHSAEVVPCTHKVVYPMSPGLEEQCRNPPSDRHRSKINPGTSLLVYSPTALALSGKVVLHKLS
jgi:hypothetical protein